MSLTMLDDGIRSARRLTGIGVPYRICTVGVRTPLPSFDVLKRGLCCTEFLDLVRRGGGKSQIGGTPRWGTFLESNFEYLEAFDSSRWYCVGSVPFQYWRGAEQEGHISIISRPNQKMMESAGIIGCVESRTPAEYTWQGGFQVVGTMPDFPGAEGLPWQSPWGSLSVAGYPGNCASPRATAVWMARVAEVIYGLPGILPVMTSCVEMTGGWIGEGCVTDVPGYLRAVDHYSVGWFQQQYDDNPAGVVFGWGSYQQLINAEYALSRFLDVALAKAPDWPVTGAEYKKSRAYSANALGEWAQDVQRSAFPDRYAKIGYPMAKDLLAGTIWAV